MPPISPKTQQMMQLPGSEQETQLFEQSFSDMAQSMLMNKVPELASDVVTFKIIQSDIDSGCAVGAFILQRPSGILYIPVVLSDNKIKPVEIMYSKEHDVFLPISPEWIQEIDKGGVESLGTGVKTPETLYTDVDIRNLVVPPTVGRYSYASAQDLKLPEFLDRADNKTRLKMANLLKRDLGLLKVAVAIYGSQALKDMTALRTEKVAEDASKVTAPTGALYVATRETDPREFAKAFGKDAPLAMRGVAVKGFYAKDTRKNLKRPVNTESQVKLQEIKSPGAYRVYLNDGKPMTALIIPRPTEFENPFRYDLRGGPQQIADGKMKLIPKARYYHDDIPHVEKMEYIGILEDGRCMHLRNAIMGEPLQMDELKGAAAAAAEAASGNPKMPKAGEHGLFLRIRGGKISATQSVDIESVSTGSDGVKRIKATPLFDTIIITIDPKKPTGQIVHPKGEQVVLMPEDYTFVALKDHVREDDMVHDPHQLASVYMDQLQVEGATPLDIKEAGDAFYINGNTKPLNKIAAIIEVAKVAHISVPDAELVVKTAAETGGVRILAADTDTLQKIASTRHGKTTQSGIPDGYYGNLGGYLVVTHDRGPLLHVGPPEDFPGGAQFNMHLYDPRAEDTALRGKVFTFGPGGSLKTAAEKDGKKEKSPTKKTTTVVEPAAAPAAAGGMPPGGDPSAQGGMPPGGDPSAQGGMPADPSQDPAAAAAMQQQASMAAPDPVSQAAQEIQEEVQRQHETQMQLLQQKLQVLQSVAARAQEIQQGVPKEQSPALMAATDVTGGAAGAGGQAPQSPTAAAPGGMPGGQAAPDASAAGAMPPLGGAGPEMPMDPSMMQQAAGLADPSMFDASAIASLAEHSMLKDLVNQYMPTLEKSIDHLGRILLSLWIKGDDLRTQMGEAQYTGLEDRLRSLFRGMGDLVLKINRSSLVLDDDHDDMSASSGASTGLA